MAHSMIIAEPVGIAVGILAGRVGAKVGRHIAEELDVPKWVAWAFPVGGAMVTHYVASAITKAVINTAAIDPVGGAANVAVTSPTTSVLHGVVEAVSEVLQSIPGMPDDIDLDGLLSEAFGQSQEELDTIANAISPDQSYTDALPDAHLSHDAALSGGHAEPLFGGLANTQTIAGLQVGPECGIHSVGNIAQMNNPGINESINDFIRQIEAPFQHQGLAPVPGGWALDMAHYEHILENYFNTPVHWEYFDPSRIQAFLHSGHGILAVGDAHFLDPATYPNPGLWHAFNLTDIITDQNGRQFYAGLDSNHPGAVRFWLVDNVHNAITNAPYNQSALITDGPVRWPYKT